MATTTTPAPDDDVEKILTGIMAKQSPLMKQARTQGLQAAQTAGLGQSTMGAKAAQAAAYNVAMPIASQQSQQIHQKGMQTAGFGHETALQQAGFGQETAMQGREFGQQSKLQTSQFGHETGMQKAGFGHAATQAELDRAQQTMLTDKTAYLDRLKMHEGAGLERGTLAIQQKHDANMQALNRSSQERLAAMEINAADKERALSAMTQFNNAHASAYATIAGNPDIPSDARNGMLAHINTMYNHNSNLTTSLYRYTVPW